MKIKYKYTHTHIIIIIIINIFFGFLLADFVTGFFHWFEDTYLDYCINIPFLDNIAKDNELHHYYPRSILAYSIFENLFFSLIITISVLLILLFFNIKITWFIGSFLFFSTLANVIHKFTHYRECETPVWFQNIQKTGLICSNEHHRKHHSLVNEKYGVITEYNNYIIDKIKFYRGVEWLIYKITGILPNRKPSPNEYNEIITNLHYEAKKDCPNIASRQEIENLKIKLQTWKKCKNK